MRVPDALIQPIAADDVAAEVARVAVGEPLNGIREYRGDRTKSRSKSLPDRSWPSTVRTRRSWSTRRPRYFGTRLQQRSLVTDD